MHRLSRLLVLVAAVAPQVAHAWQPAPTASTARVGDLVRVRTSGRTSYRGILELASRDSVVIRDGRRRTADGGRQTADARHRRQHA